MRSLKNFILLFKNLSQDFKRYTSSKNPLIVLAKMFHNSGMVFSVVYRFQRYLMYESNVLFQIIGYILYPLYFLLTYYILSYHIEPCVDIDGGLLLHNMDIVITDRVKAGKNFSVMGQVTVGVNFTTAEDTNIIFGDNITIGAGAKVIASKKMTIADKVIIGANAVVTKSISETDSTYGGVPAKLIKLNS